MKKTTIIILAALTVGAAITFAGPPQRMNKQEVLEFLEVKAPWVLEELEEVREYEPAQYENRLREIGNEVRHYQEVKQVAPDVADSLLRAHKLERDSMELAREISETADPDKKAAMKIQLRSMLEQIFDARLAERQLEIRQLQKEIEEIRGNLEKRRQSRQEIIDRRMKAMMFEADEAMGWW